MSSHAHPNRSPSGSPRVLRKASSAAGLGQTQRGHPSPSGSMTPSPSAGRKSVLGVRAGGKVGHVSGNDVSGRPMSPADNGRKAVRAKSAMAISGTGHAAVEMRMDHLAKEFSELLGVGGGAHVDEWMLFALLMNSSTVPHQTFARMHYSSSPSSPSSSHQPDPWWYRLIFSSRTSISKSSNATQSQQTVSAQIQTPQQIQTNIIQTTTTTTIPTTPPPNIHRTTPFLRLSTSIDQLSARIDIKELLTTLPQLRNHPEITSKLLGTIEKLPSPKVIATRLEKMSLLTRSLTQAVERAADRVLEGSVLRKITEEYDDVNVYPELAKAATVRVGSELGEQEREFVDRRKVVVAKAFSKFLGEEVEPEDAPIIGIAGSGGGCRAMVTTLGALDTLRSNNLLDAVTYMAGVSGSTWAMAQLYSLPGINTTTRTPHTYQALSHAKAALARDILNPFDISDLLTGPGGEMVLTTVSHRVKAAKSIKTVDLFGAVLTARFLAAGGNSGAGTGTSVVNVGRGSGRGQPRPLAVTLSAQAEELKSSGLPYPIYTAVTRSEHKDTLESGERYNWVEFTPHEVGLTVDTKKETGAWIPS
ncbi:hypothetical protein HDU76_008663, partial [Blyttiomyces sp. JEL0837]